MRSSHKYNYIDARSYQRYVKSDFQNDVINDRRWLDYYNSDNVDIKWDLFKNTVIEHADFHCPEKKSQE